MIYSLVKEEPEATKKTAEIKTKMKKKIKKIKKKKVVVIVRKKIRKRRRKDSPTNPLLVRKN